VSPLHDDDSPGWAAVQPYSQRIGKDVTAGPNHDDVRRRRVAGDYVAGEVLLEALCTTLNKANGAPLSRTLT
jgi:hypothetical protein